MINLFVTLMNTVADWLGSFISSVFPVDPFTDYIVLDSNSALAVGISWLNWFIPVEKIYYILVAAGTAFIVLLLIKLISRFVVGMS